MKRWGDIALDAARANPDVTVVTPVTAMPDAAAQWLAQHPAPLPAAQSIVLPLPPSANRYWRNYNGVTVVSDDAKAYKAGVWLVAQQTGMHPYIAPVAVHLHVYRKQRRGDLDNFVKATLDALIGIAYQDDDQVTELHVYRHDDKANPRVEVDVRQVTA
jgi:crossover junction endodeoxyribonuclease RusA